MLPDPMQEYERKSKNLDTERAIARSTAINKSRLEKIRARQDVIMQIASDSKGKLQASAPWGRSEHGGYHTRPRTRPQIRPLLRPPQSGP